MASVNLIPQIKFRYFNSNGGPLVGGKVYTYVTGTNTPQDTYSDAAGNTLNSNPIILDSRGECDLYLISGKGYRITVTTSSDVPLETTDGVFGAAPTASDNWLNVQAFGAIGNGTADDTAAVQAAINAATTSPRATLYVPAGTYKITAQLNINGRIAMVGDGMRNTFFNYTPTTGSLFQWTADGTYSYIKGIACEGPGRTLGWTANCYTTYQSAPCVFMVWEQCNIEHFPMWGVDINDSFACAFRDCRIRQNGVRASLVGLGLDGQGGGIRLQRIQFTGAASTGNDYTNCYFTGNNWGVQVEPSGSNNKAFNTRFDNCFAEENYIGIDLRNLGTGGNGRYQFLNTTYFEANLFAGAMLDEGTTVACYQNNTTPGTGTPPSVSLDGADGIVFDARFMEDRPSRFRIGNNGAAPYDLTDANAFTIDKGETTNYVTKLVIARGNGITFSSGAGSTTSTRTTITSGAGSPEGVVTANSGSIYMRNGSTGIQVYTKTTNSSSTGWMSLGYLFGATADRPTADATNKGAQYYDTDILRVVTSNGAGVWREYNGLTLVTGDTASQPAKIQGATYYNTDANALLVTDGSRWHQIYGTPSYVQATNGGTTTLPARVILNVNSNTATIATHTVVFPSGANAVSGDTIMYVTAGTITALTVSAGTSTILNAPTTLLAGTSMEFTYNDSSTTWYRVR